MLATLVLAILASVPAIYWQDRRNYERRDAALMLPCAVISRSLAISLTIFFTRLGYPLRDVAFASMDRLIGIDVAAIVSWVTARHAIEAVSVASYACLGKLLLAAVCLPALAGRKREAQQLVISNAIAFVLAIPFLIFAPAVGPWIGYHFRAAEAQLQFQRGMLSFQTASVCFPSFHVIWAILSTRALWWMKRVRVFLVAISALIVASAVTTGWHYAIDVFGGLAFAYVSLSVADAVLSAGFKSRLLGAVEWVSPRPKKPWGLS